jgi:hypothetical protein
MERRQYPFDSSKLSCDTMPFLTKCYLERTRGERCQSGSFSITLKNESIIVGHLFETKSKLRRNKYFRSITINGIDFQLRRGQNEGDDLFEALRDGESFDASVVQPGARGIFNLSDAGSMCRLGV